MIEFHLEQRTGVAPYMQLVQQVKRALRLGLLQPGDQLPTVREVVTMIAINPNTVFKAYRELERDGLVESRPGLGTFVRTQLRVPDHESLERLRVSLQQWLEQAAGVGLDDESVVDLLMDTLQKRRAALS
ncbi:GntR family transcriptional regulator [Ktedonobacter robiniae]|uniref:GntR family transcriptional regulator n=1 Tax=Ktedonobacter robiniae TaxID=2778365 RepID=A0ABQ3V0X6_9CHLR|nr:GntR family transcriptional regulator [Ktedonobacter robiniae]GHO58789.1 GntR family transcriptional regulator [Ktedonobacter robiniae]